MSKVTTTRPGTAAEYPEWVTPYTAHRVANAVLAEEGYVRPEGPLPSQQFYNYTTGRLNAGKAPCAGLVCGKREGQVLVNRDSIISWAREYVRKAQAGGIRSKSSAAVELQEI